MAGVARCRVPRTSESITLGFQYSGAPLASQDSEAITKMHLGWLS